MSIALTMLSRGERLIQFLFPAQTDGWLTILRIGLGLQVLFYALSLQGDWNYLFGATVGGLNGRALSEALLSTESPFIPRFGWLVTLGSYLRMSEQLVLSLSWWCLPLVAFALLAGLLSRTAAICAWFLHLCAAKSGSFVSYGVDNFMTIALFYLMLSPLPDHRSLDWQWRHLPSKDPHLLGFFSRVLQIHLCVIYFFSGVAKFLGSGWWNGSSIWRALTRPPFNTIPPEILVHWRYVFPVAGIAICLVEIGYPFLIWPKKTRPLWLGLVLGMHVAIGLIMKLYLFALIMIVLNLAAFGPDLLIRSEPATPIQRREFAKS